jgi:hypothetical protein
LHASFGSRKLTSPMTREQTDYVLPTYGLRTHAEPLESDRLSAH